MSDYIIYHHGIEGQKWGVRNAEWYPISAWKNSVKGAVAKHKNKAEIAKVRKSAKKQAEEQAERNKILETGSAKEILKANDKYKFTTDEVKRVEDRFNNENKLKNIANNQARNRVKEISDKIGPIVDAVKLFNSVTSTGIAGLNNIGKIKALFNKEEIEEDKDKKETPKPSNDKQKKSNNSDAKGEKSSKWYNAAEKVADAYDDYTETKNDESFISKELLQLPAKKII